MCHEVTCVRAIRFWKSFHLMHTTQALCREPQRAVRRTEAVWRTDARRTEMLEIWKQHFDEHLNAAESASNEGENSEGDSCVSTVDYGYQKALSNWEVEQLRLTRLLAMMVWELNSWVWARRGWPHDCLGWLSESGRCNNIRRSRNKSRPGNGNSSRLEFRAKHVSSLTTVV